MNASEIRVVLHNRYELPKSEVDDIKGITALRERLEEEENLGEVNDKFEFESDEELFEEAKEVKGEAKEEMSVTHPGWQDYVMDLFTENELEDWDGQKRPNIHGLRRVSQIWFGLFQSNTSKTIQAPNPANRYHAVVEADICFVSGLHVSDVADIACHDEYTNSESKYAMHASSTAATKAESRALRKVLQLNFISAEESTPDHLPDVKLGKITEQQVMALEIACERHDVNVIELVNSGEQHYTNIKKVSKDAAHAILAILQDPEKRESFLSSRDGIVGFNTNWKELFHE